MAAEARALTDLAASVADGRPIDWTSVEAELGPGEQRIVRHLQLVSTVAQLYRSLPAPSLEPGVGGAEPEGPRWGPLVMLDSLGTGTTAEVFRAWDVALQREVALKLFPPDDGSSRGRTNVLSEARRLARVRHPNVATVYGAERHGDRVGFWMELVDGASLDDILRRQGPFGAHEAALIGCEIASALAAVHRAGLLHRDVKAQNVLREAGGRIVLTDFGTGEEVNAPGPTRMAGTPMYLAPEILRGKPASVQTDIYSLGVLLFYLLTGRFPIQATTMLDLARGHAEGRRQRLRDARPELPAALGDVIEKALAESPSDRFSTAGAFEEALRRTLHPAAVITPFPVEGTPVTAAPRRSLVYFAFAAAMVLTLALPSWKSLGTHAALQPRIGSLAVLPLVDRTGQDPQLADAMTNQLITTLGQLGALRVTSNSSVRGFKGQQTSPAEIARQLGVDAVLEGTLAAEPRPAGGARRVRVNARLLAAGSGMELWSGSFDAALGTLGTIETGMAKSIARSIHVAVTPQESDRLRTPGPTSPQAEEAYFQGRYYLNQFGVESARRALAAFGRAVVLDPGYATAHAALARTYITLGFLGALSQPEARARALAAASKASTLAPDSAEAVAAVADLKFYYDWDWQGAQAAYQRAISLAPSSAYTRTQYARFLAAAGRTSEAVDEATLAAQLDPLSAIAAQTTGLVLYYAREYDRAAIQLQHALEIDPTFVRIRIVLARVREAQGRLDDALQETERAIAGAQVADQAWYAYRARILALQGDRTAAEAAVRESRRSELRVPPENLAYVYLALGDDQKALELLDEAIDQRDPALLWLAVDPRVDSLRGSPRFESTIERLGRP